MWRESSAKFSTSGRQGKFLSTDCVMLLTFILLQEQELTQVVCAFVSSHLLHLELQTTIDLRTRRREVQRLPRRIKPSLLLSFFV